MFVSVANTFTLVGLRRTVSANLCGNLAQQLLVGRAQYDVGLAGALGFHTFRQFVLNRVGEAQSGSVSCPEPQHGNQHLAAAAFFSKPLLTPVTMLFTSARVVPAKALADLPPFLGAKVRTLSSCFTSTSPWMLWLSSPLPPLTEIPPSFRVTVTPPGISIGAFATRRHIGNSLENSAEHFAADTRLRVLRGQLITPLEVEMIATPRPPRTLGSSPEPA